MKKGIRGSSGEEVVLLERRLQENDIEEPLASQAEDPLGSTDSAAANIRHSDNSDVEEEQEFVSSLVTQGRGRRTVHWEDLPDHKTRDQPEQVSERVICGEETPAEDEITVKSNLSKVKVGVDSQRLPLNTVNFNGDQTPQDVEKATHDLQLCSLSDATPRLVDSVSVRAGGAARPDGRAEPLPSTNRMDGNQANHQAASTNLNICQVGMSKRGAAALRDLLSSHGAAAKPDSVRLRLLAGLRRTFEEWCTAATQQFLYGTSHAHSGPPPKVSPDTPGEELDEDDLADEATDADGQAASDKVADFEKLREEVQQQERRVRGFYKRTWSPPERAEDSPADKASG